MAALPEDVLPADDERSVLPEKPGASRHRRHRRESRRVARRQQRIARRHGNPVMPLGFYEKHHAADCGRPECGVCGNPRRLECSKSERLTIQARRQPPLDEELAGLEQTSRASYAWTRRVMR